MGCALVAAAGAALMLARLLDWRPPAEWPPSLQLMQFNTALLFVTGAISLRLSGRWPRLAASLAAFTAGLAGVTLSQHLFGWELGIDQLLHVHRGVTNPLAPGRMTPLPALSFLLLGAIVLLLERGRGVIPARSATLLATAFSAIALSALIGNALGALPIIAWSGLGFLTLPTTLLLTLLALPLNLLTRQRLHEVEPLTTPPWYAELLLLTMLIGSLLLWRSLAQAEERRLVERQLSETRWMASRLGSELNSPLLPLRRMAERWRIERRSPALEWEAEAAALIRDLPGLVSLQWLDAQRTVQREYSHDGSRRLVGTRPNVDPVRLALLERSLATGAPVLSDPLPLLQGGLGLLIYLPLQVEDRADGWLVAVIRLGDRLEALLEGHPDGWQLGVSFNGEMLFAEHPALGQAGSRGVSRAPLFDNDPRWQVWSRPADGAPRSSMPELILGSVLGTALLLHLALLFWSSSRQRAAALGAAHQALQDTHAHSQMLLDSSADAILSVDREGRIRAFNAATQRIFGYPAGVLLDQPLALLFESGAVDEARAQQWLDTLGRSAGPHRALHRDGSERLVESATVSVADTEAHSVLTLRDVTDRQRARDLASEASERFRLAADSAGIGIWERRFDSDELIWDRWMYRLFGYATQHPEPAEQIWRRSVHPEDAERVESEIRMALRGARNLDTEFRIQRGDGQIAYLRGFAKLQRDERGQPQRLIGVNYDITERKRLDRLKGEFVATVSHELRTPLTSISGALGLIGSGAMGPLSEPMKPLLNVAQNNAARLTLLINDLLDMEKIAAGGLQFQLLRHRLSTLATQAIEANRSYAEPLAVHLQLQPGAEDPEVEVDAHRIQQVLSNLLSNAAKFSEPGSTVELTWHGLGERVRIEVVDHGRGIPAEFQSRVFEKFSQADSSDTRRRGGTGLGLAISRELVERMGGSMGFDSIEGQGSTFWFELPVLADAAAPA